MPYHPANLHEKLTPKCEQGLFSNPATEPRPVSNHNQVTVQPIAEQLQDGCATLKRKRPGNDTAQVSYVTLEVEH